MAMHTGQEFLIEAISSIEVKVVGGTARTWTLHPHQAGSNGVQVAEEWYKAYRPKIDGWIVFMYDPSNQHRQPWPEYETPSKHAARLKAMSKKR